MLTASDVYYIGPVWSLAVKASARAFKAKRTAARKKLSAKLADRERKLAEARRVSALLEAARENGQDPNQAVAGGDDELDLYGGGRGSYGASNRYQSGGGGAKGGIKNAYQVKQVEQAEADEEEEEEEDDDDVDSDVEERLQREEEEAEQQRRQMIQARQKVGCEGNHIAPHIANMRIMTHFSHSHDESFRAEYQ